MLAIFALLYALVFSYRFTRLILNTVLNQQVMFAARRDRKRFDLLAGVGRESQRRFAFIKHPTILFDLPFQATVVAG